MTSRPLSLLIVSALLGLCLPGPSRSVAAPPPLETAPPHEVGMDAVRLSFVDPIVEEGLREGQMAGCVVLVGRKGKIVYQQAFGERQSDPESVAMTEETVFDLASLTKPVATATSVMHLVEQGLVNLDEPVATYVPEFAANGKEEITIVDLLTHQGGLIPDNSIRDYEDDPVTAMEKTLATKPIASRGERFIYSDVGFIVLGEMVKRLSDKSVHEYSQEHIFGPLGMTETGYLPREDLRQRAAVTEKRDGEWMQGEVHDPRAYRLGGVAGHAGLFSTAQDLAVYATMMINGGEYGGVRVLEEETVERMTRPTKVPRGLRALGWDVNSPYSSNRGDLMSDRAFGHGGFTGTTMWIDPTQELFVIFLSNRLHPDGKGSVNSLAGRIGTVAAAAIVEPSGLTAPEAP
ncbi:Esterase EstB [Maioricimonas rarisocia]|uniref:Esterase EstB n=1 Tax=Maioricimonas rarisocia TaxID=2528026 RepID=A0A517Z9C6_9PLAN|nr:serine hydrolase domain-containing protein [Maioricimonas rarisocia]QDU39087.1 Esterase EstB [Maioricimonas rarisocia]